MRFSSPPITQGLVALTDQGSGFSLAELGAGSLCGATYRGQYNDMHTRPTPYTGRPVNRNMSQLVCLPVELVKAICNFCSSVDIKRLCETCSSLRNIAVSMYNLTNRLSSHTQMYLSSIETSISVLTMPTSPANIWTRGGIEYPRTSPGVNGLYWIASSSTDKSSLCIRCKDPRALASICAYYKGLALTYLAYMKKSAKTKICQLE